MAIPSSIENKDPFAKAIPGYSLTQPPGKWAWEKPPQFADPDEAIEFILDRVEEPQAVERYTKLMLAGISIEEIVTSISIAGFQEGMINPDVAELIKMPLAIYFMDMADKLNIPVNVFATLDGGPMGMEDEGMDDETLLEIMSRRNPQLFIEVANQYRPQETPEVAEGMLEVEAEPRGGFLEVEVEEDES